MSRSWGSPRSRARAASASADGLHRLAILLLLAALTACAESPTAPEIVDLTGIWRGALPIRTPGADDWSDARLALLHTAGTLSGTLSSADGVLHDVSGTVDGRQATISVDGLPGTSTCAGVTLLVSDMEFRGTRVVRLSGRVSGRCFGTIAGSFVLQRVS